MPVAQIESLPILIPRHARQVEAHQKIGSTGGIQRPEKMIARVDNIPYPTPRNVFEYRFERPAVSVHVRNEGEPRHRYLPPTPMQTMPARIMPSAPIFARVMGSLKKIFDQNMVQT